MTKKGTTTEYGEAYYGESPFIVLAPHGAGDDYNTEVLARELHKQLGATSFINTKYVKPTNEKQEKPVTDFNHLKWYYDKKVYIMSDKHPAMRAFYRDSYRHAKALYKSGKTPIIIHLHALNHKSIAADLGAGFTSKKCPSSELRLPSKGELFDNTGVITCKPQRMYALRRHFSRALSERELSSRVTIGCVYPGTSRQTAVQYHFHRHPYACVFQIEVSRTLRRKARIERTAASLAEALTETFTKQSL